MSLNELLLLTAIVVLVVNVCSGADLFFGILSMKRLSAVACQRDSSPLVSVILPACNEEKNVEEAVLSQLRQDYPSLEIIVINDRSTDGTGEILERLKKKYPQLRVVHISTLPPGWMGKANALQRGAEQAGGEYLLFTDGDIVMEKTTVSRAVNRMLEEDLDHLTLLFKNTTPGWLLNSLILESGAGLIQALRPWKAKKKGRYFIGVGAFNLVKKKVYTAIGGHEGFRMHPIDDIMLGKRIKRMGYAQECLLGIDMVTVPWYASLGDMVEGLMKNILAVIHYRFTLLPLLIAAIFICNILPLWGALFFHGVTQYLFFAVVCVKLLCFLVGARLLGISPLCGCGTIFTPYITVFILLRAAWCNIRDGGIIWRGTHYPLKALRNNEPLFF